MRFIVFILMTFMALEAGAQADQKGIESTTNQSIELYNKHQYSEALAVLDTIKQSRDQNVIWYYYYGLNQARLRQYDQAIANLDTYIKKSELVNTARAHYFLGLLQFYSGDYEKAVNSLELSLDISRDPKLDRSTDLLIEKTLKYREYYETHKPTNIMLLIGYNYDSDVLNVSKELFAENLTGHILNYGASISHRLVDQYNFVFEPSLAILDNFTLDSTFKANSTVQSNDMLQILVSAPIIFYIESEKSPTRYDFSLNGYSSYLPISSSVRELYLSSFFLKGKVLTQLSTTYSLSFNATVAADKSYGFTSQDDDASGLRFEFYSNLTQYLTRDRVNSINYDIGGSFKNSTGINSRYKKYVAGVAYVSPAFWDTTASTRLGLEYLNYADKATPRTDNKGSFDYVVTKNFSAQSALSFSLGFDSGSSNVDLYKYTDFNFGVQYVTVFGF